MASAFPTPTPSFVSRSKPRGLLRVCASVARGVKRPAQSAVEAGKFDPSFVQPGIKQGVTRQWWSRTGSALDADGTHLRVRHVDAAGVRHRTVCVRGAGALQDACTIPNPIYHV